MVLARTTTAFSPNVETRANCDDRSPVRVVDPQEQVPRALKKENGEWIQWKRYNENDRNEKEQKPENNNSWIPRNDAQPRKQHHVGCEANASHGQPDKNRTLNKFFEMHNPNDSKMSTLKRLQEEQQYISILRLGDVNPDHPIDQGIE